MRQKNSVPLQIEKGFENSLPHVEEVTEEHKKAVESVQRHSLRLLYFYKIKIRTAGHQHFPLPTVRLEGMEPVHLQPEQDLQPDLPQRQLSECSML